MLSQKENHNPLQLAVEGGNNDVVQFLLKDITEVIITLCVHPYIPTKVSYCIYI